MTNTKRHRAFIKIKHSIQSATNSAHLQSCQTMIENAMPICSKDEIIILNEYMQTASKLLAPIQMIEDEVLTNYHRRLSPQ